MTDRLPNAMIYVDIVEKGRNGWRIIGICPDSVTPTGSLHVYAGRHAKVLDSGTDEVIVGGHSLADVLRKLAAKAGMTVVLTDEATWHERRFTPEAVA
ncbi:MAG TPA: hypothetical protein VFC19_45525 [Candidatus Limnocylindrales bacterium]|nr:hypothetical protein [Candidatus Limnocylindrales bacterium]